MNWGPLKTLTTLGSQRVPAPGLSSCPQHQQVNSGFYIILLSLSALVSSFSNMYPEKPQFWINLSLGVYTSTSWLNIIRGRDEALLLRIDPGKTTTQVSIPTSQQVLGLRSSMSLDNLAKPSYFHPSSKLPTHLAFKNHLASYHSERIQGHQGELPHLFINVFSSGPLFYCSPVSRKKVSLPPVWG